VTSAALKTTLEIKLGNCSPYTKRHFCIDPITTLVSHQAVLHILQQNCAHGYNSVAAFSSGGETTDWSFQLSVNLQVTRSAWWKLVLLVNKCLVCLGISWVAKNIQSLSVN